MSPKELSGANMDNLEVKLARRRLLRRARRHLDLFFNPSNSSYPSMDDEEIRARYLTAAPKNMHINQALKNRIQVGDVIIRIIP
ncbi:unnamed protein product [Protopolystoma xenopodis]|uniref:Uncharacterized protein n=1 Tax=Protopolystoma xenopodis TaxID=117903 RepID=A0A3S5B0G9_9PLAT|nr:unnamed protein product [Protopolystoma xenopodis]